MALLFAIIPASAAAATPEDIEATHAYLIATNSYEEAELANLPQQIAAREAAAARISSECPGVLANVPRHEEEALNSRQMFTPRASNGCQPQPYAIVYGLLKAPHDTVLARVSGELVPLRKVLIPAHLHAGGVLVYGAFSPLPTELLVRDARGTTIGREDLAQNATSITETCEGEAE